MELQSWGPLKLVNGSSRCIDTNLPEFGNINTGILNDILGNQLTFNTNKPEHLTSAVLTVDENFLHFSNLDLSEICRGQEFPCPMPIYW